VRGDLAFSVLTRLGVVDLTHLEELTLLFHEEAMSELVDTSNIELAAEGLNEAIRLDLIPCEVVISHVHEAGLSHLKVNGQSLSLHKESKVVTAVVRVVYFSNFNGVVSKEVVNDER
jgi:hypothetical protein